MPSLEEMIADLQCPICGHVNTYTLKDIDVPYKIGNDTVTVTVRAGVCSVCGEHAYNAAASAKIDAAISALRTQAHAQLQQEGAAYRYA